MVALFKEYLGKPSWVMMSNVWHFLKGRSSRPEVFCKKGIIKNFTKFTGKHLCQRLFFNKVAGLRPGTCNFIKKKTLAQVFYCQFCEIFKNAFFYRTPPVTATDFLKVWEIFMLWLDCQTGGCLPTNSWELSVLTV